MGEARRRTNGDEMRSGVTFGEALRVLWLGVLGRCPSCRSASMFRGWIEMPERCPNCGLKYQVESGAWLGALAVGYAAGAAVAVALTVIEVLWHPLANAGLSPLWVITALGIASVLPAYRPAKGLWFALLWLYEFTEGGRRTV
jgi:uncharacterized protein (DUF983 family)